MAARSCFVGFQEDSVSVLGLFSTFSAHLAYTKTVLVFRGGLTFTGAAPVGGVPGTLPCFLKGRAIVF